jgi:type VI secretion system protein VasJ
MVFRNAETVLEQKGKDLLIAGYLAFAMYAEQGLSELPAGLLVVAGLMDTFGDTMFPTRPRGRGNALSWFVTQVEKRLGEETLDPSQREVVLQVDAAIKELMTVARDKLEDAAPGFSPLRERMQRMLMAVPEKKPEPPPPPKPTAAPPKPAAAAPRPATAPAPAAPMPEAADVSSAEDVTKFLVATGQSLVKAAALLRTADASTAAAYRLLRTGLWLHIVRPPPGDAGGKTNVPALPANRRQQLETILANGKWLAAIEETESALRQFRFCLDLNRMTHNALLALGDSHAEAASAVATETASFIRRMPGLLEMQAGDGSPFADDETRAWVAEHAGSGGAPTGGGASDDGGNAEALAELRGLMKTKPQDGMKRGKELIDGSTSPRSRMLSRLALAEACLDADQPKLARGMYAAIDREMRERRLEDWDPPLVSRCLEGFIRSIRAAVKAGSPYQGSEEIFERLCLVDPAAAAKLS